MNIHICEFCKKEHDGTYGSGRFCSNSCRMAYIASKVKNHKCNWNSNKNHKPFRTWKCPHCDFIGETRSKLKEHQHKEHQQFCVEGGWNKGLTKETNPIVKQYGENISYNQKSGKTIPFWKGKHHSEETKKKMSQTCGGKREGSGRGKHGRYHGIWCDSSWELAWVIYYLEHNIKFKRYNGYFLYSFENKIHRYYPDFELDDGTIIEIKGYKNRFWEAKLAQFPSNKKLIVLSKNEMKPYIDYAVTKYGSNFTNLYESKK